MQIKCVMRKIMWGDLDSLGIVFYPRYYEWIDASSHLFFESIDLNLQRLWKKKHIQFGLIETSCKYHQPGRYHQSLRIETGIKALSQKTITMAHTIFHTLDDTLMVKGLETRVCMDVSDPNIIKARNIPDDVYSVLNKAFISE